MTTLFKAILICSVFSIPYMAPHGYAMEEQNDESFIHSYLTGHSTTLQRVAPSQGMAREFAERFSQDICESAKKDCALAYEIGKKVALKRDLGVVVTELMEACLTDANQKLIGQFFKPGGGQEGEFNEEALVSLIKLIADKFTYTLRYFTHREKLYAYDSKGNRLPVYRDEHIFDALMDACLPDALGKAKGMMKGFVNFKPIHDYLMNKFNHLLVKSISDLYHNVTGKTLKQSLADLVNRSIAGQGDGKQKEKSPELPEEVNVPEEEVKQTGSYAWNYLKPQLIHCMRLAFCDVIKPNLERAIKDLGYYSLLKIVPRSNLSSSYLASATLGTIAVSAAGGGTPLGLLIGGSIGLAGYYAGSTAKDSFLKVVRNRVITYLDLLVQFKVDQFLPYSYEEHCLYYLNGNPTELEKSFYGADYQFQKRLNQQTLIGSLLKDAVQYSWLARIFTVSHMDEPRTDSSGLSSNKNDLALKLALGAIAAKRKNGKPLSLEEENLFNNLQTYPSYDVKASEIELIKMWGEKDKKISEKARLLREERDKAEGKLIEIYDLYMRQIPREIAWAYQQLGNGGEYADHELFSLDYSEVEEIIAESLKKHIGQFSENDLEMLQEAIKDGEFLMDFIDQYMEEAGSSLTDSVYLIQNIERQGPVSEGKFIVKDITEVMARGILQSQDLTRELVNSYVQDKLQRYIRANEAELQALQQSVLGFGLSQIDMIHLHKSMDVSRRAAYLAKKYLPYEEAIEKAVESLNSDASDESLEPEAQAIKEELCLIAKKLSSLIKGCYPYVVQHYTHEFIKWVKENSGEEYQEFLNQKLKEHAIENFTEEEAQLSQGRINNLYIQLKEDYNNVSPKDLVSAIQKSDFVANKIMSENGGWSTLNGFRFELQRIVRNADVRTAIYQQIRTFLLTDLLNCQFKPDSREIDGQEWFCMKIDSIGETGEKKEEKKNNFSLLRLIYAEPQKLDVVQTDKEDEGVKLEKEGEPITMEIDRLENLEESNGAFPSLEPYANLGASNAYDVAEIALSRIVNKMVKDGSIHDITTLSYDDCKVIHQKIHSRKKKKLMEMDFLPFIDQHLTALIYHKSTLAEYNDRLFYGYSEIIERMMGERDRSIKEIIREKREKDGAQS